MSLAATLMFASAAVYVFASLHYAGLWAMRPEADEHRWFALMCLGLGGYACAAAYLVEAHEVAEGALAQRGQMFFAMILGAAFFSFATAITGRPLPRAARVVWGLLLFFAAACAAGLMVDPAFASPYYDGSAEGLASNRPVAALTILAGIGMVVLIGSSVIAAIHIARASAQDASLRPVMAAISMPVLGGIWDFVVRISGAPLPQLFSVVPLLAVVGVAWALIGRFARIDTELAARTEELARSYDSLRAAQQELVRKEQLAAVGELSAVIAHEVRNPLAIIRNALSGLRRAELPADTTETLLGILDEENDRLNRLVQDLLTYARPVALELSRVDLAPLVHNAIELAREGQPGRTDVEFEVRSDVSEAVVDGDPGLLRHALINIADNSIHAMPEGGPVLVRLRSTLLDGRGALAVEFHDRGEGMDTIVRRRARDPFFTTRASGTGLGLAIVDRVARLHGGSVTIESSRGSGTTVTLILPCERSPVLGTFA